ncbi:Cobalamin biosynthesis protein CobD [Thiomonas sp. X19]|uniref:CobD/CbiB family protein n=1 Tax=Thiomonas sp. X19 TaxID=1050370 RepID=UPI000B65D9A0|nr:CobD/CbiB family protein [Thiomonas sp. X19]SCC92647.1 Cobalamin biosynthesis protein CobD [Thiomonas sp. X19]
MAFFSVLLALLLEQIKPLGRLSVVYGARKSLADFAARNFDAGERRHGLAAWFIAVLLPALVSLLIYWAALRVNILLAFAWNVVVLYFTLGFRQFSHYFTDISDALSHGDVAGARAILKQWKALDTVEMSADDVTQQTIEHALVAAQRYVLGVFFWFLLPLGPAGAVLYRMAEYTAGKWNATGSDASPWLRDFADQAFHVLDWLPARLTAASYAVVGNFEEAVDRWRNYARLWPDSNTGAMLASAAGAVGIRLGATALSSMPEPGEQAWASAIDPEVQPPGQQAQMPGDIPTPAHLRSVVGLVWRSVLLWMLLLAVVTITMWVS